MPTNIDDKELARLEELSIACQSEYVHGYVYLACNAIPALVAEVRRLRDYKDAGEFEAMVAAKLARMDFEDVPCAHGMKMFCPKPPHAGDNCGAWCLLRMARLEVEAEMEKYADRE